MTFTVDLTHDHDPGFLKVKFLNSCICEIVCLVGVKWKGSKLTTYWADWVNVQLNIFFILGAHSPGVESEEEPRPLEKKTHKVAKRVSEAATEPKAKKVCAEPLPKLPAMGPESVSCVDGAAVGKVFQVGHEFCYI